MTDLANRIICGDALEQLRRLAKAAMPLLDPPAPHNERASE